MCWAVISPIKPLETLAQQTLLTMPQVVDFTWHQAHLISHQEGVVFRARVGWFVPGAAVLSHLSQLRDFPQLAEYPPEKPHPNQKEHGKDGQASVFRG